METATFGSEFVAARTAVDQIIDVRTTFMYLGVPVNPKSYVFGDNKVVVDNANILTSVLSKRSHLAAYHQVWEAIAAEYLLFLGRMENPTLQISLASIRDFQLFGHCSNLCLFSMEILLNLALNQRRVTRFLDKIITRVKIKIREMVINGSQKTF